jgi:hypothetical protein
VIIAIGTNIKPTMALIITPSVFSEVDFMDSSVVDPPASGIAQLFCSTTIRGA